MHFQNFFLLTLLYQSLGERAIRDTLCNQTPCGNNGIFDTDSCKCSCLSGYSGNDCSIGADCGSLPNDPDICSKDWCLDTDLKALCPKTCNCQKSPILSTIWPEPCIQVQCKNNGLFDPASCKCSCISGYSGNDCSIDPDCGYLPNDPDICSKDFCLDTDLKALCPKTCNCQKSPILSTISTITTILNSDTIFSKESTQLLTESSSLTVSSSISPEIVSTSADTTNINVPTILLSETDSISDSTKTSFDKTTVSQNLCTQIFCQNNGVFDPASCKCSCISGYSGNDCSIGPDCGSLPNDPDICSKDFCLDTDLKALCPKTCNCQKSPILSTISPEPCIQVQCKNNGLFDPASCKCSCISGYSGNDCSFGPDCETLQDDPEICSQDFCPDNDLKVLCPKTCNCTP